MVVQAHCKPEEKMGMYPSEWWWAERQVNEILAEHPGELVKTGEGRGWFICSRIPQHPLLCTAQSLEVQQDPAHGL